MNIEELKAEWKMVKNGKDNYPFSDRHHTPTPPIFRII